MVHLAVAVESNVEASPVAGKDPVAGQGEVSGANPAPAGYLAYFPFLNSEGRYPEAGDKVKTPVMFDSSRLAQQDGVKPTARTFATTPKTVRLWLRRYQANGYAGLKEWSRAPKHPARRITPAHYPA